ncbi:MAG: phage holin family protein [Polyangia bacterium]
MARHLHLSVGEEARVHQSSMPETMTSADLVKELSANASLLLQRQVKLATLEAKQELRKGKTMVELFGVAGLCAYAGALLLLIAAALAIGAALDGRYWAGALIVAGVLFVPAAITGLLGYQKRLTNPMQRSRAELSKEITWAKYRTT